MFYQLSGERTPSCIRWYIQTVIKGQKSKFGVKRENWCCWLYAGSMRTGFDQRSPHWNGQGECSFLNVLTVELWTVPTLEQSRGCKEYSLIL